MERLPSFPDATNVAEKLHFFDDLHWFGFHNGSDSAADLGDEAEILPVAAKQYQANLDSIRTWRGTIEITDDSVFTRSPEEKIDPHVTKSEATVEFVCDRQKKAFRSNYSCRKMEIKGAMPHELGRNDHLPHKPVLNIMVKDDGYYRFLYDAGYDSLPSEDGKRQIPVGRFAVISPSNERKGTQALGEEIDPFYWFTYRGRNVKEVFDNYYAWHKAKEDLSHVSLSQTGNIVTLVVRGGDQGFNTFTVDLGQGANLIGYSAASGPRETLENWTYEYAIVNGAWVPRRVTLEMVLPDEFHIIRTLQWVKSVVNEPVKEEEFSLVKLGLRQGDEVQDHRIGKTYRIKSADYPPATGTASGTPSLK